MQVAEGLEEEANDLNTVQATLDALTTQTDKHVLHSSIYTVHQNIIWASQKRWNTKGG